MTSRTRRIVTDDAVTEVTTTVSRRPRNVHWDDLLDACRIEPDDRQDSPWEQGDGFEHELRAPHEDDDGYDFFGERYARIDGPWRIVITGDWPDGNYRHYRAAGMSKQSARELVARQIRKTRDYLAGWYTCEWHYVGVVCEYLGARASLWGIDSEDYARECFAETAEEVADELESQGYQIVGRPTAEDDRAARLAARRKQLRENWLSY